MSDWQPIRLGDFISVKGGLSYKSQFVGEGDARMVGMGCVSHTDRFIEDGLKAYSGEYSGVHNLIPGDLVIATRQQSDNLPILGFPAKIPPTLAQSKVFVATNMYKVFNTSEISNDFLFWLLRSGDYKKFVVSNSKGTTVRMITKDVVENYRFLCPPLAERQRISGVLDGLEDKIELNRRMNEALEEMARALFRDWFVDFGPTRRQMEGRADPAAIMGHAFPPEKAATLAPLFPAILGEDGLPEGWESHPLDKIGDFLNGLALQKFPAQEGKPDLPVVKIAELRNGISAKSNRASTDVPKKYVIGNGDFIFSWSGSLMAKFWTGGAGALNQHLFKVTSETHPMWFVSEWVQTHLEEFQRIAASKAVTMGHIKRSHLAEATCVCPPDPSLAAFGEVMEPLIAKQIANDEENQTLAEMRDLLLPKLMSGEIRLKDVEAEF